MTVALLLVRWFPRVTAWRPLLVTTALAVAVLVRFDAEAQPRSAVLPLRAAAVLLALGAAYALDDDAATVTAAAPTPLATRRGVRAVVAAATVGLVWSGLVAYATAIAVEPVPAAALAVEAAALLAAVLALASVVGGAVAGPVLIALLLVAAHVGRWFPLLAASPRDPEWDAAHWRWAAILAVAVVALAVTSRDPAAAVRRPRRCRSAR